jgi:hypothetical protein
MEISNVRFSTSYARRSTRVHRPDVTNRGAAFNALDSIGRIAEVA